MNTICTYPPVSPATAVPTFRPLWQRLWLDHVQGALEQWRAAARQRAQWRALEGLGDATLRDIGMAERMPVQQPTLPWADLERGRW